MATINRNNFENLSETEVSAAYDLHSEISKRRLTHVLNNSEEVCKELHYIPVIIQGGYMLNAFSALTITLAEHAMWMSESARVLLLQGIHDEVDGDIAKMEAIACDVAYTLQQLIKRGDDKLLSVYEAGRFIASGSNDPVAFIGVGQ